MTMLEFLHRNKHLSTEEQYLEYNSLEKPICFCGKYQRFLSSLKGYLGYCSIYCKTSKEKYNLENITRIIHDEGLIFKSRELKKIREVLGLEPSDLYLMKFPDARSVCDVCSGSVKFISLREGFRRTCSTKCGNSLPRRKLTPEEQTQANTKRVQTCFEKYGVSTNLQLIDTSGENNPSHREDVKIKRRETMLNKYGVQHALQSQEFLDKVRNANKEKYGQEHIMQTDEGKQKFTQSMQDKYGVDYAMQSEEMVQRFRESRINSDRELQVVGGYVYLVFFTELRLFKIGMSRNFKDRATGLRRDFGVFETIKLIHSNDSKNLERTLHLKFNSKRVLLESGSGKTEFFELENQDVKYILNLSPKGVTNPL